MNYIGGYAKKKGFAVAEIKLQHCKTYKDNKDWLDLLKNGFTDTKGKTAELYIKVEATEQVFTIKDKGVFLKESPFKMIGNNWHEPVDNPISTNYMQTYKGDTDGHKWGLFGDKIRKEINRKHTGLDLFAKTGTNVYACLDGTVYNRRWHGGYGNTITIKVNDPQAFLKLKKAYALHSTDEQFLGKDWRESGDVYLYYAHLHSVEEFSYGDEVKSGEVLGTTGRSGVTEGTRAPHLHFEIFCKYVMATGTRYRINPAYFVSYKHHSEQSEEERQNQLNEFNEGKTIEVNGTGKLSTNNLF